MKKTVLYSLISITAIAPLVLDLVIFSEVRMNHLWFLALIPITLLVVLIPQWKVLFISGVLLTGLKYVSDWYYHNHFFSSDSVLNSLISWSIIILFTYFRIEAVRKSKALDDTIAELKERENFLNATLDGMSDGLITCDSKGKPIYMNRIAKEFKEESNLDFGVSNGFYTLFDEDGNEIASANTPLSHALQGKTVVNQKIYLRDNNGKIYHLLVSANPLNEHGAILLFKDTTYQDEQDRQLKLTLDQYKEIFTSSSDSIHVFDKSGVVLNVNEAFEDLFEWNADEVVGSKIKIIPDNLTEEFFSYVKDLEVNTESKINGIKTKMMKKNGELIDVSMTLSPVFNDKGELELISCLIRDVTEQRNYERKLKELAYYDELTSLPNRKMLEKFMIKSIKRSKRHETKMGVFFIDLDGFKAVNDKLGHATGDQLLVEVSNRFDQSVREDDVVARLGGDEFIIVLEDITEEQLGDIAQRIINKIASPFVFGGQEVKVTPSVGISVYPSDAEQQDDLIQKADEAMYYAKKNGKNNFVFYEPDLAEKSESLLNRIVRKVVSTVQN